MPAYLKLPSIDGEVEEADHAKWIEVTSFSWGVSRSIAPDARGAERRSGETQISEVVFTKESDSAMPATMMAVASGKHLDEVELHLCSTINNKNVTNIEYKFKDVIISSYSQSASSTGQPMESFSINFTKVEFNYKAYDRMGEDAGNFPGMIDTEAARTN
jgi:type VI secretion system secreted protein Hcp